MTTKYRATIITNAHDYFYVDCDTRSAAEQTISRWVGMLTNPDYTGFGYLEYKPFCYAKISAITGIELEEFDYDMAPVYYDECQTKLDDFITYDGSQTSSTVVGKEV